MKMPWDFHISNESFTHEGYPCLALRNEGLKFWCGYVGVQDGHPWYGKNYDEDGLDRIQVHGGLTFSGRIEPNSESLSLLWWLGFDCGHMMDKIPGDIIRDYGRSLAREVAALQTYRDINYVKDQIKNLVKQAGEAANGNSNVGPIDSSDLERN